MTQFERQPLVTRAQNREDLYLWALVGHRTPGPYVDVGCNHERLHSVTRLFYERGWSGLNIDANPAMAPEYECRERDTFVLSGVGSEEGTLIFREYPGRDGLSTFDPTVKDLHDVERYEFVDRPIAVRTLASILDEHHVIAIDFLKVDVEGLEASVLSGLDLAAVRPAVIVVEASRAADCDAILLPERYHVEFFDGLNTYYVDSDLDDITIHNYAGRVLRRGSLTVTEYRLERFLQLFPLRRIWSVWIGVVGRVRRLPWPERHPSEPTDHAG